jgi:large subunit ribosomal protein L1
MGKVRTRILGLENLEQEQKEEQKKRSMEKKMDKQKEDDELRETDEAIEPKKKAKKTKKEEIEEVKPKHKRGKKYMESAKKVDSKKAYTLDEAVSHLKKMKYAKFEESVELHLNVDTTGLKGEVDLPFSTGKTVRVVIVDDKIIEDIEGGKIEFDILVAHPSFMPKLAKFAKVLGPKGLMPNPKAGTVSPHPEEVVKKFEKGVLRWKTEPKFPLVHQLIAKGSHEDAKIVENAKAFITAVGKGHISAAYIKTTMSPALMIDLNTI